MRCNTVSVSMASMAWRCGSRSAIRKTSHQRLAPSDRLITACVSCTRSVSSSPSEQAEEGKKVSVQERKAAGTALVSFLRDRKGFNVSEASGVQRGSPMFATKLALLAKDSASAPAVWNSEAVKTGSTLILDEQRINVAEAILESLGGSSEWVEQAVSQVDRSDEGIRNILGIVEVLQNIGFVRKKMWVLFNSNALLWGSSSADAETSIAALKELGVGKDLMKVITGCPLLIGRDSEEFLGGVISELRRVEVDEKEVFSFLSLFQKSKDVVRPVTDILQEQHGLIKEDVRRSLSSSALRLLLQVNPPLANSLSWCSTHGIEEKLFWKLAVHNPAICRSSEALEAQVNMLMQFGLSHSEVLQILTKHSQYLAWSSKVLEPKLEYLVKTMNYPVQMLLTSPRYLSCSLDCKIKPRHHLVQWLEKQGKMEKPTTLAYLFISENAFLRTYGSMHKDALEVYKSKQSESVCEEKSFEGSGTSGKEIPSETGEVSLAEAVQSEAVISGGQPEHEVVGEIRDTQEDLKIGEFSPPISISSANMELSLKASSSESTLTAEVVDPDASFKSESLPPSVTSLPGIGPREDVSAPSVDEDDSSDSDVQNSKSPGKIEAEERPGTSDDSLQGTSVNSGEESTQTAALDETSSAKASGTETAPSSPVMPPEVEGLADFNPRTGAVDFSSRPGCGTFEQNFDPAMRSTEAVHESSPHNVAPEVEPLEVHDAFGVVRFPRRDISSQNPKPGERQASLEFDAETDRSLLQGTSSSASSSGLVGETDSGRTPAAAAAAASQDHSSSQAGSVSGKTEPKSSPGAMETVELAAVAAATVAAASSATIGKATDKQEQIDEVITPPTDTDDYKQLPDQGGGGAAAADHRLGFLGFFRNIFSRP